MKLRILVVILAIVATAWIWNAVKLFSCDFESPYRCEVIHGIGVAVPPLSIVAAWFDDDDEEEEQE